MNYNYCAYLEYSLQYYNDTLHIFPVTLYIEAYYIS